MTFIRPDTITNAALRKGLNFKLKKAKINFYIGIDIFSNNGLKKIDKQLTVEDCFETIDIILENGFDISATTILGWPFLEEDDVIEVKKWIDKYSTYGIRLVGNELQLKVNTKLHDMYDGTPNIFGSFYVGKQVLLDSKQEYLNKVVVEYMQEKIPKNLFTSRIGKFERQKNNY
jgi:radical SAM superfamily enzyme